MKNILIKWLNTINNNLKNINNNKNNNNLKNL